MTDEEFEKIIKLVTGFETQILTTSLETLQIWMNIPYFGKDDKERIQQASKYMMCSLMTAWMSTLFSVYENLTKEKAEEFNKSFFDCVYKKVEFTFKQLKMIGENDDEID